MEHRIYTLKVQSFFMVNVGKSEIIPIGLVDDVHLLAEVLGCQVGSFPPSYLGLPLVRHSNQKQIGTCWLKGFRKGLQFGRGRT